MKNLPKRTQKGFTLVELLVVVLIISVLAGIIVTVINSQGIRQKSRDSQRIADLRKMQTALELYFADNRTYPPAANWILVTGTTDALTSVLKPTYMSDVPTEPTPIGTNTGPCQTETNLRYNYKSVGGWYFLTAIMEVPTSNDGHECNQLNTWSTNSGCTQTAAMIDVCYGVQNP